MQFLTPILIIFLLGGFIIFWNTFSDGRVTKHDAETARDPDTGIILKAEPRILGAADADKAVLFVHGFAGSPNNFSDLPDQVAEAGWHVEAILLPGHGTSPRDFENTTADELEAAVKEKMAALRERYATVVLLGHSMGGALSTLTAASLPPDGLILVAPYYAVTHQWYYLLRPETWAGILSPIIRWVYRTPAMQPVNRLEAKDKIVSYAWVPTKGAQTAIRIASRARTDRIFNKIDMPVLLIHSLLDTVTDPKESENIFNALPSQDKQAVWLEISDHIVFWDFERERVAQEVLAFLRKIESPPPSE